jgi:hypothetical protein
MSCYGTRPLVGAPAWVECHPEEGAEAENRHWEVEEALSGPSAFPVAAALPQRFEGEAVSQGEELLGASPVVLLPALPLVLRVMLQQALNDVTPMVVLEGALPQALGALLAA